MKKLKLNLEDLKVESFEISNNLNQKGTVIGQAYDTQPAACPVSEPCSQYGPTCVGGTCQDYLCQATKACYEPTYGCDTRPLTCPDGSQMSPTCVGYTFCGNTCIGYTCGGQACQAQ